MDGMDTLPAHQSFEQETLEKVWLFVSRFRSFDAIILDPGECMHVVDAEGYSVVKKTGSFS